MKERSRLGRVIDWLEDRINLTEMFSLLSIFGVFYTEVDTGKRLRPALREALAKPVPSYYRWPRVLGLLILILFLFEVFTGVLLAFYYRPTDQEAYESVLVILRDVNLGWFVHQMHYWGGQLLLLVLIARLLRFYFGGLYRPPRELIWMAGAVLFLLGTHLDFSGRLLVWNNEAYWSSVRALEILFSIPLLGPLFSFFLGRLDAAAPRLHQFYFLHVAILPLLFWCGLYFSFSGIRRVGLSAIPGEESKRGLEAYLSNLFNLLILVLFIFGVLVTFAVLWPTPFGEPVNTYQTPAGVQMPWHLLTPYGFVEFFPGWIPLPVRSSLLLLLLLVFVFLPFLAPRPDAGRIAQKAMLVFGLTVFILWIAFGVYGFFLDLELQ